MGFVCCCSCSEATLSPTFVDVPVFVIIIILYWIQVSSAACPCCCAARKLLHVVENAEVVLASELHTACHALDFMRDADRPRLNTTAPLEPIYELVRETIPMVEEDTFMEPLILGAQKLVRTGVIWRRVMQRFHELYGESGAHKQ